MKDQVDPTLLSAIASNTPALVESLLKMGVDCNSRNQHGVTPLHFAAERYSVDAARVLLDYGADVNAQDAYGNTPLARAVYRSKRGSELELIKLLLSRGADPGVKNQVGESARDIGKGNPVLQTLLSA